MAFEVIAPGQWVSYPVLESGTCSISTDGGGKFRREDLELVGIRDRAIVLADKATKRIALRKPRDGEQEQSVPVSQTQPKGKPDRGRRRVSLHRAIRAIGFKLRDSTGRFELVTKDDLLIVQLGVTAAESEKPAGRKAAARSD